MRISDWSSDVCSSDLVAVADRVHEAPVAADERDDGHGHAAVGDDRQHPEQPLQGALDLAFGARLPGIAGVAHRAHCPEQPGHSALGHALQTAAGHRSEEHTAELQSLMRISYAVFCLTKTKITQDHTENTYIESEYA